MPETSPSVGVLGKLLVAMQTLEILPDVQSMAAFLQMALSEVPGTASVVLCQNAAILPPDQAAVTMVDLRCPRAAGTSGSAPACRLMERPDIHQINLSTLRRTFGCMLIVVDDAARFRDYEPFLVNVGHLIATILENREDARALAEANTRLSGIVAELDEAREAAQADHALLRAVADSLLDPHVLLEAVRDEGGRIVDFTYTGANPAAGVHYGRDYGELIGAPLLDLMPGHEGGAGLLEPYRHVVETGEPLVLDDIVCAHELLSGAERRYDVRAARVGDGLSTTWRDVTDRHTAIGALARSEERFRGAFDDAPVGIVITDLEGGWLQFNAAFARLTGYTMDQLRQMSATDLLLPDELATRRASLQEVANTHKPQVRMHEVRHADGHLVLVNVTTAPLCDEAGTQVAFISHIEDVTEHERANQDVRRMAAILANSNDAILSMTLDGIITTWNPAAERLYGYSEAEAVGRPISFLVPPGQLDDTREILARIGRGERIEPYETTRICQDARVIDVSLSVTPIRDSRGALIGASSIARDVTDRKRAEESVLLEKNIELVAQQFYTRSLIESNIDALMATDPQGIITDVNQQMMTLTGCTRAELIGAPFRDFFTDPERADAGIARALAERKVSNYELTVRARNGQETYVSYNAATFHDRDDNLLGVFAAARDVTDRRRIERDLLEKNTELEHASRMKSEFLATMSHELRTPLNSVIGFSEAMQDGLTGALTERQQEYIGDIFTSGKHLLSLINDILDLSKVEAGMMNLDLEEVDVRLLLESSLSVVRDNAAARHIALELELDEDLGVTHLDTRKTRQIIYNLLSNAVKFSEAGGRVSLRARRAKRPSVVTLDVGLPAGAWPVRSFALAANEFDDFVEIRVTDAGIGISEEDLARLFQPFTQIDSGLARRFEGTGLGLAMVKQMTELLGGGVAVASKPGVGTCFAVWIPLRTGIRSAVEHEAVAE